MQVTFVGEDTAEAFRQSAIKSLTEMTERVKSQEHTTALKRDRDAIYNRVQGMKIAIDFLSSVKIVIK